MSRKESFIEDIEKMLDRFAKENEEDSYVEYLNEGEENEEYIEDAIKAIVDQYEDIVTDWVLDNVGGFDSPGYDLSCNSLIFVVEGKIVSYSVNFEIF